MPHLTELLKTIGALSAPHENYGRTAALSGRRQPCCRQRQHAAMDDQPTLRRCISAGRPEFGHFPIADLRSLDEIVNGQLAADPATLGVDQDIQQIGVLGPFRPLRGWSEFCCAACSPMGAELPRRAAPDQQWERRCNVPHGSLNPAADAERR